MVTMLSSFISLFVAEEEGIEREKTERVVGIHLSCSDK